MQQLAFLTNFSAADFKDFKLLLAVEQIILSLKSKMDIKQKAGVKLSVKTEIKWRK